MSAGRTLVPLIIVPDEGCGPAMFALSPPMRAFVVAKVHFGCNNAEAARRAGYSKNHPADARIQAYRLAHSDEVQAAIIEESRKVMCAEGPRSIRTLVTIRDNPKEEAKDRIKAALELLNRGGLNAVSEHHLTVEHTMTDAQKDRRIIELCRELGVPEIEARKMLVAPDAIDAEFTEVTPEPERTPEQQRRHDTYERTGEREKQAARRAMSPEELAAHKQRTREQSSAERKARYAAARAAPPSSDGIEDLLA
jgi:hypothetical protein